MRSRHGRVASRVDIGCAAGISAVRILSSAGRLLGRGEFYFCWLVWDAVGGGLKVIALKLGVDISTCERS